MHRWAGMLCALSVLSLSLGLGERGGYEHARPGPKQTLHAHTHYHDGVEHTHWHSHPVDDEHPAPDSEGDHHQEFEGSEHDPLPFHAKARQVLDGRETRGKLLTFCLCGGALRQAEPPPLPPPKPPPATSCGNDSIERLRTVILLT